MDVSSLLFPALFAVVAVISIAALLLVLSLKRKVREQERNYAALINVLRNEIRAMNSASVGVGKRLQQVERKLNITVEKQLELENRDPGALAYNQAAKLMEMGADVEDLISSCGIARPEAELMALLHREIHATQALESGR